MARPTILMQECVLSDIWRKHQDGVPVLALIRQYDIGDIITAPTLTKLIKCMTLMENAVPEVEELIYNSLFPRWLLAEEDNLTVVTQPKGVFYKGVMPMGEWIEK